MTAPRWEDSGQGDLLELVAKGSPSTGTADAEWEFFEATLRSEARIAEGVIDPNRLREDFRGRIAPRRISAFYSRAIARDLIVADGWVVSEDFSGKNSGKPARRYRWLGGVL